jgi:AcrR family transcriptional regulator
LVEGSQQGEKQAKVAKLLDAALPEFAHAGLAGARVDDIARAAGMNKRLLYHYVGDKTALFEASLNLAYDRIVAAPEGLHGDEWRLVCHGCAAGRTDRLSELQGLAGSRGDPAGAAALGLRLLVGLLPELADSLLGNREGDEAGRRRALGLALRGLRGAAAKPRLKLRPDLRSGGGQQN